MARRSALPRESWPLSNLRSLEPLALLLATGTALGIGFPIGKLASTAGIAPLVWAFWIAAGSIVVLLLLRAFGGADRPFPAARRVAAFCLVSALISYVLPNLLLYSVIGRLGAGYSGLMFTFSPIVTLLFAIALRSYAPSPLGMVGIGIGFVGAVLIALTKTPLAATDLARIADPVDLAMAFGIPVSLAAGNTYRSRYWPRDEGGAAVEGRDLAIATNIAALLLYLGAAPVFGGLPLADLAKAPGLSLAQALASGAMFALFFRLQRVGGPVYLSQMGYVGAAVGLAAGVFALSESYPPVTWLGALVVAFGITLTTRAQRRSSAAG